MNQLFFVHVYMHKNVTMFFFLTSGAGLRVEGIPVVPGEQIVLECLCELQLILIYHACDISNAYPEMQMLKECVVFISTL